VSLPPGIRLGPYEIRAVVQLARLGEAYDAYDHEGQRRVGLRVLPLAGSNDPERRTRFEEYARAAALLEHPNILTSHDIGTDGHAAYIVSEPLSGSSLRALLGHGALAVATAAQYGSQVARGLAAAHAAGVVHRDLSPDNILVTPDSEVKILGFGLSEATQPEWALARGAPLAPPHYLAPEQVCAAPTDARTDMFAFGAILYEMLAGHRAFSGTSPVETMRAVLKFEPPSLTRGDVPAAMIALVNACLQKNPAARPSAEAVSRALEPFTSQRVASVAGRVAAVLAAAALIGAAVLAGMWLTDDGGAAGSVSRSQGESFSAPPPSSPERDESAPAAGPPQTALAQPDAGPPLLEPEPRPEADPQLAREREPESRREPRPLRSLTPPPPSLRSVAPPRSALVRPAAPVVAPDMPTPAVSSPEARTAAPLSPATSAADAPVDPAIPGSRSVYFPSRLALVDSSGVEGSTLIVEADYGDMTLSADATRIAASIRDEHGDGADIWTIDIAARRRTIITSDVADDVAPIWAGDGQILFSSDRGGSYDVYERAADGSGDPVPVVRAAGDQIAYDWAPAARYVLYQSNQPGAAGGNMDLWARRLPDGRPFAYLRSVHAASQPSFSPDGRWVVYTSLENGVEDVYVARFPKYDGRRRISAGGGSWARWRGDRIYYVDAENRLTAVPVTRQGRDVHPGAAVILYPIALKPGRGYPYDVSADGQRVLVNVPQ
jgi:serine/threonine protein kinase